MSLTELFQKFVLVKEAYGLVKFLFLLLIVIGVLFWKGSPWWLTLGFLVFGSGFTVLSIIQFKKIKAVNLEERKINLSTKNVKNIRGEKVLHAVFGIIRNYRKGYEVLEVGEVSNPENSMLITNKRIIFFAVPVAGEGKSVYDVDFSMVNVLFNQKSIKEKGMKMVASMTLQEILQNYKDNYEITFNEVKEIKITWFWGRGIKITDIEGNSAKYAIKDKEELEKLKNIFNESVPNRLK